MSEEIKSKVEEVIPSMDDFKEELEESFRQHRAAKRSDMASWEKILDDFENKRNLEVEVKEAVKSGVTTTLDGVRAFIPASKLSLDFVDEKELSDWVGKRLQVRIITAEPENNKLVLSARDILREEARELQKEKMEQLKVGAVVEGKVESIKDYGAFVDIGDGVTGLLHVSQISNKRIKSPADVLKPGQTVNVMITKVADGRISLSIRALEADKEEREERRERESFRENYKESGAVTTSLGSLLKGIKL